MEKKTNSPPKSATTRQTRGTTKEKDASTSPPTRGRSRQQNSQQSPKKSASSSSNHDSGSQTPSQSLLRNRTDATANEHAQDPTSLTAIDHFTTAAGRLTAQASSSQSTEILVTAPDSSTRSFEGSVVSSPDGKGVRVRVTPSRSAKKTRKSYISKLEAEPSPMDHNYDTPELHVVEWKKRMQKNEVYIDKLKKDKKRLGTKLCRANKKIEKLLKSLMLEQKMHNETQQTLRAIMQSLKLEVVSQK